MSTAHLAAFVWFVLASIWGSTWLMIKLGLDDQVPPFTLMLLRFVLAALALGVAGLIRRSFVRMSAHDWLWIAFTGNLIIGINYSCVYWGEALIPSGLAAIVYTTLPLIGAVIAHILLPDEPLTPSKGAGVALGLLGVGVIFADQLSVSGPKAIMGAGAIIAAVVSTAFSATYIKLRLRHVNPILLTWGQVVLSLPLMLGLTLVFEGSPFDKQWTTDSLWGAAYLGIVGSALTFGLLNWLYRHMDVTKTQLIPLGSTLIAIFLGWLVRDEVLGWRTLTGSLLIISGLFVTVRYGRKLQTPS